MVETLPFLEHQVLTKQLGLIPWQDVDSKYGKAKKSVFPVTRLTLIFAP